MLEFAKIIDQAGFPDGVVSVITGDAENCSIPLTRHPQVDRIAFTGGPETARHVVRNSAENFAVTTLELGGKSPILVFEDADLDSAANGLIAANFGASGQSCVAGSRGLIHRSILPDLIARIKDKASGIVVGDPLNSATHIGPLCTGAQMIALLILWIRHNRRVRQSILGVRPLNGMETTWHRRWWNAPQRIPKRCTSKCLALLCH